MDSSLQQIGIGLLSGCISGAFALLIGGVGAMFGLTRRVKALEAEAEDLHERLVSEQKKRAGQAGVLAKTDKARELEASALAAEIRQSTPRVLKLPGRMTNGL